MDYQMASSTQKITKRKSFLISQPKSYKSVNTKSITKTFQQFYQSRSKSFSIIQNIKNMKQNTNDFIDKQFIDAIDQKTPTKRITEFIKRKVNPNNRKIKTQQIQFLKDPQLQQNKKHVKIFSNVFNRQRNKVLSKFQNNKQMRQTVYQKLGMTKPKQKPFFDLERKHIFSFEDRYRDVFKQLNAQKKYKKSMKRVHPICDIYQQESKNVMKSRSIQRTKTINYQPFGNIDYSARYF